MIKDSKTGALGAFDFENLIDKIPELNLLDCTIKTISFKKPIDSSNMNPDYWIKCAEIIESNSASTRSLSSKSVLRFSAPASTSSINILLSIFSLSKS